MYVANANCIICIVYSTENTQTNRTPLSDRQMNISDMAFYFTLTPQRRRIKGDDLFSIVIFSQHVNHF